MTSFMTQTAARILLLPLLMVSFGILLKGYVDTGDGFSAGVVASLAMIIQAVSLGPVAIERSAVFRLAPFATFVGLFLALLVAFVPVLFGDPIMMHRPEAGAHATHFGILEFITPVLFDIGVYLIVFGCCTGAIGAVAREAIRRDRGVA